MNPKTRNALASICLTYVRDKHPQDFEILSKMVEDNYKLGSPTYTQATVFRLFKASKAAALPDC